ncbi:MAG: DUF2807 domain-containing protein [Weeksellaceae bacterium]|nr:DUF2807 domain-containing protein [Weeksellaceae bacterium]
MKKLLTLLFTGLVLASCSSSVDGEGVATAQKNFTVDQITKLNLSCNCNVTLIPGNEVGVKVESHQNIVDNLMVEAKNGSLTIKENSPVDQYSAYDVFVYVTRDLKQAEFSNQATVKVSGTLNVDDLEMDVNDQVKIEDAYLITNNFKLSVHDQAAVTLKGTSISLIYNGESQSKAELFDFETNDAQAYTSDNAILNINSRKSITGSAKGNSVITYIGEPSKDTKIADNAQVVKK